MKYIIESNLLAFKELEMVGREIDQTQFEHFFTADFESLVRSRVFDALGDPEPDEEPECYGKALDLADAIMTMAYTCMLDRGEIHYSYTKGFLNFYKDETEGYICIRRVDV